MKRSVARIPSLIASLALIAGLILVAGCQAQGVKPQTAESAAAQASRAQANTTASVEKFFDKMLTSNEQVEQRITLMQEQVIKLNQQMGAVQQRNLQLLQAIQRMQLVQQTHAAVNEEQSPGSPSSSDDPITVVLARLDQMEAGINQSAPSSSESTPSATVGFRLVSAYTGKGQWVIFKYDEITGLTWSAQDGGWLEIAELTSLPSSLYQVVLRPAAGDIKGYVAARVDRETGQSWWLKGNSWAPFQ